MKSIILLILTSISFFQVAFSQLTIRNDNYIFVNDQLFFIEDNISLLEINSKFYLRNESQLIQGTGVTGNTGIGQLSVHQNGTTHNYAYNYWCSPIGNNSSFIGNENFRANLIDDSTGLIGSIDAAFTSSHDGMSTPLTISSYWIYTFENATLYSQWFQQGATGSIAPGLGFTMKGTSGSGNNQLYDFRGKPNTGTISNSVTAGEWTLIGNPYPSAIDAVAFIHDTQNSSAITGTLYYWEQDLTVLSHYIEDYVGGYATYTINATGTVETFVPATFDTYNGDGSLNTTGSNSASGKQAKRYIPIAQGFMVEGSVATTGNVQVKNMHRVYYKQSNPNSIFFRANPDSSPVSSFTLVPDDYKRFRLNVDFNEVYTRQLVQTFHPTEATFMHDYGLECISPLGTNKDAYWILNDIPYSAQAQPFSEDLIIPIIFSLNKPQSIRIRVLDIQNFADDLPIYLHDKEVDSFTNLRIDFFEIDLVEGVYDDRFEIVFSTTNTLGTNEETTLTINVFQNNTGRQLNIHNPKLQNIKQIILYDMLGKKVLSKDQLPLKTNYTLNTDTLKSGVYIVSVKSNSNQEILVKKIIVKN